MADPLSRRAALRAGLALGAAGGLAGIAELASVGGSAAAGRQLRIGYLPITDSAPLLIAHAQGRYTQACLDVARPILFRSWASLAEAFLAAEVDVVHLLMPFAIQLRYALGAAVRVIAWNHTNGSALTVAPGLGRIEELAGRQVAIPYWWSIHNVVSQQMLRTAGLRPVVREQPSAAAGTVQMVVMSPADMLPALDTGTIGGYVVADPFNAAAEIKKVGRIARFVGDAWRDHACCVVVVRQKLIDRAPEQVQGLVDALAAAQLWINTHRQATAGLLSSGRYLPQPVAAITRALTYPTERYTASGALHHPSWQGQRIGFAPYPFPSYTRRLVEAMRETAVDGDTGFLADIDPETVHRELVDDRFVLRALAGLGGPGAFGLPDSLNRVEEVEPA
ncbi:ABC transporter substrate-binding protein [Carbonactinospora thermoautotrophica]|uniref:ABC transporter substrate-binding protein n=1 Tax=Carbonactinospora thermoautotrophica TaxID=1469144 RepID=UPI0022708252|nr:ABC transporter substrate-binding protein [Carbonactinospora thermoautotrophica]MCX9192371.1 ABC transporter substrate-binding protein [Carbonactinospora thermoautotrophica]